MTPSRPLLAAAALLAALLGCAAEGGLAPVERRLTGEWGGEHLALVATTSGATTEFDCAHGGILGPIILDAAGRFVAAGVHVREPGGPLPGDWDPDTLPATYAGVRRGDALAIIVIVETDTLGPFALTRGTAGRVTKCV